MTLKPLLSRHHDLANPEAQLKFLSNGIFASEGLPTFAEKLKTSGQFPLKPVPVEILQINVGYMCNQVCAHCHVDAGPQRKEIMTRDTMEHVLNVLRHTEVHTLDLTGGAPEMNPDFRWFVEECTKIGVKDFIVRSNLTIILANEKYHNLPGFFRDHNIHVVSSLPFYRRERTDKQRGNGVFDKSIKALQMLNAVGYGVEGTGLKLDLVYNPAGAFLPASQSALESEFKKNLFDDFGILFNSLFTITNLPISRFLEYLVNTENYEDYMDTLVSAFNPAAVQNVMCRNTISVGYDGYLYDCDFNQMLQLKVNARKQHISEFDLAELAARNIVVSQHCYGCTAGAGSSCQGSIT
jgi:radical SAM/Cys-rich protein